MNITFVTLALLVAAALSLNCQQGFVANSLSICIEPRYIEGCNEYKTEKSCKTCEYRYVLKPNGLCELDKETTEDCCSTRAGDGSCLKCKSGLYLINGKCQESNILGCLEKDSLGMCINCASEFFLKAGSCIKTIKNCVKFTDESKSICTDCSHGYSLYNNICVQNSILGCKNEVDHVCKECYKPFILTNGNCEINHCKTYNDYRCVACQCGFFLTSEGICKPMDNGCIRYQRGQCTDCLPNFRLKGSQCIIEGCEQIKKLKCTRCSSGYQLVNNGCSMKNCIAWKDGACEICGSGYNLKGGKCVGKQSIETD